MFIPQNQNIKNKEWIVSGLEQSMLPLGVTMSEIDPNRDVKINFPNGYYMTVKHLNNPHWWCEITYTHPGIQYNTVIKVKNLDDLVDKVEEYAVEISFFQE